MVSGAELWVAVPGEWWVLCGYVDAGGSLKGYKVHASAPFETPRTADEIVYVDLGLDFMVAGINPRSWTRMSSTPTRARWPTPMMW